MWVWLTCVRGWNSSPWWFLCSLLSWLESCPGKRQVWLLLDLEPSYLTKGGVFWRFWNSLTASLIIDHIALIWKLDSTESPGNTANTNILGLQSIYFRNWQYFRIICLSQSWKHRRCEQWVIIRKFHMSTYFPSHSIRAWALWVKQYPSVHSVRKYVLTISG